MDINNCLLIVTLHIICINCKKTADSQLHNDRLAVLQCTFEDSFINNVGCSFCTKSVSLTGTINFSFASEVKDLQKEGKNYNGDRWTKHKDKQDERVIFRAFLPIFLFPNFFFVVFCTSPPVRFYSYTTFFSVFLFATNLLTEEKPVYV